MHKRVQSIKKGLINMCNRLLTNQRQKNENATIKNDVLNIRLISQNKAHSSLFVFKRKEKNKKKKNSNDSIRTTKVNLKLVETIRTNNGVSSDYGVVACGIDHEIETIKTTTLSNIQQQQSKQQSQQQQVILSVPSTSRDIYVNDFFYENKTNEPIDFDQSFPVEDSELTNVTDKITKQSIIQYLLDYQIEFLASLKYGLENYIRPISALLNGTLFFYTFQNIEKIYSITSYIRNAIIEQFNLTSDIYVSTVTVLYESISTLQSTYGIYMNGYEESLISLNNSQLISAINKLNDTYGSKFNLHKYVDLPLENLVKIYSVFKSLLEMTSELYEDNHVQLNTICSSIKKILNQDGLDVSKILIVEDTISEYSQIYSVAKNERKSKLHSDLSELQYSRVKRKSNKSSKSNKRRHHHQQNNSYRVISNGELRKTKKSKAKSTTHNQEIINSNYNNYDFYDYVDIDGNKCYLV